MFRDANRIARIPGQRCRVEACARNSPLDNLQPSAEPTSKQPSFRVAENRCRALLVQTVGAGRAVVQVSVMGPGRPGGEVLRDVRNAFKYPKPPLPEGERTDSAHAGAIVPPPGR